MKFITKAVQLLFSKEYLRDVYPHASRWQMVKFKVRRALVNMYRAIALCALVYGIGWSGATFFPSVVRAEIPVTVDATPQKIEALKDDVVNRLTACESQNYTEDDAIVIYDNNSAGSLTGKDVWSYGQLQWKVGTIKDQVRMRDGITITNKEAKLLAFDTPKAKALAKFTIFENDKDKKGIGHWHNCAVKEDLYDEVTIIKRLEKVLSGN